MNTLTKALFAATLSLVLLMATAITGFAATFTFNRIKISGNVKLELIQGTKERVEIVGEYSTHNTSIKRQGYTLLIKSSESEPVTIKVTVTELSRIDACNRVSVESRGLLQLKYLQVFLADEATANVKANTESMYTFLKGNSHLNISGTTLDHTLVMDSLAKLNMGNLVARKTTTNSISEALAWSHNAR